jgi:alpha-glucosidase (family GH31 glycosyl hydrolase)
MALAKKSIALRYQLLPYNYTLAFQNSQTGIPLMRPLFFVEPNNKSLYANSRDYLWGNDILVSPVKEADVKGKEVYFPKTGNWYDLGVMKYKGGEQYRVPVKEDYVPYFVRGGAFITLTGKDIQSTEEYDSKNLTVQYIHDSEVTDSEGMFYDDDGKTPETYENGRYEILRFYSKIRGRKIKITIKSEKGNNFVAKERNIMFMVYDKNKVAKYPATIKSGETKSITLYIKS